VRAPGRHAALDHQLCDAGAVADAFRLVQNAEFRAAQERVLGHVSPTLADLRRMLDVAVSRRAPLEIRRCAGTYRRTSGRGQTARRRTARR
jgi:hypothetical protein